MSIGLVSKGFTIKDKPNHAECSATIFETFATLVLSTTSSMFHLRMPSTLGKRKRQGAEAVGNTRAVSGGPSDGHNEDFQDVFRRHFEAHFKPLPVVKMTTKIAEDVADTNDGGDSEWEGISGPEGRPQGQAP